ncbi:MAG: M15 family metallopeptidase [Candidatus Paceibacteria bacterium]
MILSNNNINKKVLLTASDLLEVPIGENGSTLVGLRDKLPSLLVEYEKDDMIAYTGDDILVREELIPLIKESYNLMQKQHPGYNFLIRYGYRHPEVQKRYFDNRYNIHKNANPNLSEMELIELTHTQVALPEVAGHPSGGAVDLTIVDKKGNELDMGTRIADYTDPEKCFTYANSISTQQKENRFFLADIMLNAGFAPYNGEWWHFSYGDREWARFYNQPSSLFGQINFRQKN